MPANDFHSNCISIAEKGDTKQIKLKMGRLCKRYLIYYIGGCLIDATKLA